MKMMNITKLIMQADTSCDGEGENRICSNFKMYLSKLPKIFQARNMRKFKIVVTERGRREMAEADEEKNKKRDKKAST